MSAGVSVGASAVTRAEVPNPNRSANHWLASQINLRADTEKSPTHVSHNFNADPFFETSFDGNVASERSSEC